MSSSTTLYLNHHCSLFSLDNVLLRYHYFCISVLNGLKCDSYWFCPLRLIYTYPRYAFVSVIDFYSCRVFNGYSETTIVHLSLQGLHPRLVTEGFELAKKKALEVSIVSFLKISSPPPPTIDGLSDRPPAYVEFPIQGVLYTPTPLAGFLPRPRF